MEKADYAKRNQEIYLLSTTGIRNASLARRFSISASRVKQIVDKAYRVKEKKEKGSELHCCGKKMEIKWLMFGNLPHGAASNYWKCSVCNREVSYDFIHRIFFTSYEGN